MDGIHDQKIIQKAIDMKGSVSPKAIADTLSRSNTHAVKLLNDCKWPNSNNKCFVSFTRGVYVLSMPYMEIKTENKPDYDILNGYLKEAEYPFDLTPENSLSVGESENIPAYKIELVIYDMNQFNKIQEHLQKKEELKTAEFTYFEKE